MFSFLKSITWKCLKNNQYKKTDRNERTYNNIDFYTIAYCIKSIHTCIIHYTLLNRVVLLFMRIARFYLNVIIVFNGYSSIKMKFQQASMHSVCRHNLKIITFLLNMTHLISSVKGVLLCFWNHSKNYQKIEEVQSFGQVSNFSAFEFCN